MTDSTIRTDIPDLRYVDTTDHIEVTLTQGKVAIIDKEDLEK